VSRSVIVASCRVRVTGDESSLSSQMGPAPRAAPPTVRAIVVPS
jgi:hypothetical protein